VVICFDQAARQAEEYGTGMTREMLYLFVHSVMHLFGYDHMEEDEKKVMRAREEKVLSEIGITR
jgi:probable rRNA maturation factor